MAQTYGQIKKMKTAKIGTIMPWAGDASEGVLMSNVPRGWILCDGKVFNASRYPILSSIIGNSYGGTTITGEFPHYSGQIKVPNLNARLLIDLEPSMLFDTRYNAGQADAFDKLSDVSGNPLVVDDGFTKAIPTLISADTNLTFTVDSDLLFAGKMTGTGTQTNISVSNPSFTAVVYTIGRKLGINHLPTHNHEGSFSTAVGGNSGPQLFEPVNFSVGGNGASVLNCGSKSWFQAFVSDPSNAHQWCQGSGLITYYDETTLITNDQFNEFISTAAKDYSQIPPSTVVPYTFESPSGYTGTFSSKPMTTHAMKAWTGMFPRPMVFNGKRNFYGYGSGFIGVTGIQDDPETGGRVVTLSTPITAGATSFSLPAGTNIGTDQNNIRPFMFVSSPPLNATFLSPGTQIINIERSGSSLANYIYTCELSQNIGGTGSQTVTVSFRDGTYPTTMNTVPQGQDPTSQTFAQHNHATFDLTMGAGLKGPTTHPVNNVSKGDVNPLPINGALNMLANVANPSQNMVFIMRAF